MGDATPKRPENLVDRVASGLIMFVLALAQAVGYSLLSIFRFKLLHYSIRLRTRYLSRTGFPISSHALLVISSFQAWYCSRSFGFDFRNGAPRLLDQFSKVDTSAIVRVVVGAATGAILFELVAYACVSLGARRSRSGRYSRRRREQRADILRYMIALTIIAPLSFLLAMAPFDTSGEAPVDAVIAISIVILPIIMLTYFLFSWSLSARSLAQLGPDGPSKNGFRGVGIYLLLAIPLLALAVTYIISVKAQSALLNEIFPTYFGRAQNLASTCATAKDGGHAVRALFHNPGDDFLLERARNFRIEIGSSPQDSDRFDGLTSPQAEADDIIVLPPHTVEAVELDVGKKDEEKLSQIGDVEWCALAPGSTFWLLPAEVPQATKNGWW